MRMRNAAVSAAGAALLAATLAICPGTAVASELATEPVVSSDEAAIVELEQGDDEAALPVLVEDVVEEAAPDPDIAPLFRDEADDETDGPADETDGPADDAPAGETDDPVVEEPEVVYDAAPMPGVAAPGTSDLDVENATDVDLYRLYNSTTDEHLYTVDASEKNQLIGSGWTDEGVAWVTPSAAKDAAFELYNPTTGDRHYTTDMEEYVRLVLAGWDQEGLAWFDDGTNDVPVYRLYNPNATMGTHLFTTSMDERLRLVSAGWSYEGIACYGVDNGPALPAGSAPDSWVQSGGSVFYVLSDGTAATGWQTIGDVRYYFDGMGRLATGLRDIAGKIYSFNSDGTLVVGWQDRSGYRYYFDGLNGLRRDGWFTLNGNTYYLDTVSGAMATGIRWIDGVMRPFASDGVCLKTGYQTSWGNLMLAARDVTLPSYTEGSYWSYVHPCVISANATREEVIEAFIDAARDYQRAGTPWVDNHCGAPGTTIDCSGLVMEALYAVGMDLTGAAGGDYNPYSKYYWNHHFANTWRLNNTFQPISISELERGDIVYYEGHVAIYLGDGVILESTPYASNVRESSMYAFGAILGCARPFTK